MTQGAISQSGAIATAANNHNPECFALRDVEGRTLMLDIHLRTGDRRAFPYAYLLGVDFARSTGISLLYSAASVHIRGRNLTQLYEGFVTQRVLWVLEGIPSRDFAAPESVPFVSDITISTR